MMTVLRCWWQFSTSVTNTDVAIKIIWLKSCYSRLLQRSWIRNVSNIQREWTKYYGKCNICNTWGQRNHFLDWNEAKYKARFHIPGWKYLKVKPDPHTQPPPALKYIYLLFRIFGWNLVPQVQRLKSQLKYLEWEKRRGLHLKICFDLRMFNMRSYKVIQVIGQTTF